MKSFLILFSFLCLYQITHAETLQCNEDIQNIKKVIESEKNVISTRNLDTYRKYLEGISYSFQFSKKHNNQYFFKNQWVSESDWIKVLTSILEIDVEKISIDALDPTENFKLSNGHEICIIPTQLSIFRENETQITRYLMIAVKEKQKEWKFETYIVNNFTAMTSTDFDELFPDYPKPRGLEQSSIVVIPKE